MRVFRALAILVLLALGGSALADESTLVKVAEGGAAGSATILVRAFFGKAEFKGTSGGAEVSVNRQFVGLAPLTLPSQPPGTSLISVKARGFRARELALSVEEKKDYELVFHLEEERGFLIVDADPVDAEVIIAGTRRPAGLIELRAGVHEVLVRRFGFIQRSFLLVLADREVRRLEARLEPAPFSLSGLESNRESFNPENAGPLGRLRLSFRVASFGSGKLGVFDEGGKEVFGRDFPSFGTWEQSAIWKGLDAAGRPLPDGPYRVRVEARAGAPPPGLRPASPENRGNERGSDPPPPLEVAELEVWIDSSRVARPLGSASGVAGLAFLPELVESPRHLGSLDFTLSQELGQGGPGLAVSGSWSGGAFLLSFAAKSGLSGKGGGPASFVLGIVHPLPSELPLRSSLTASFAASTGDELGPASFAGRAQAALGIDLAEAGAATLALPTVAIAPGLVLEWDGGAAIPRATAELGVGGSLATGAWRVGASTRLSLSGLELLLPSMAGIEAALEGRVLLGPGPLILSASLGGGLDGSGAPRPLRLGAGLGLWF